ncbi:hypothetical protein [uncultured Dokdonia sp.]|uniref:hypothetical protein n=1 Tax=uncultured Dokdonia sp. TaxID=575653 RepID=UPI00261554B5|nr:hypothetical protein [uncultured Dokdonia sp.]
MNYLKGICVLFLLSGCQVFVSEHPAIGTWNSCNNNGDYLEYKITNRHTVKLIKGSDKVWFYRTQIEDTNLVVSKFKNELELFASNDTIVIVEQSKDKMILEDIDTRETLELSKADFDFELIDTLHLEAWKSEVLADFKKRAALIYCEKKLPMLKTDDSEEEIEIIEIDSLGNQKRLYLND